MNPAKRYIQLRNQGVAHKEAVEVSGWTLIQSLKGAIFWFCVFISALVLTRCDLQAEQERQAEYVKSLEKLVNGCTDRKGTTLLIGDEVYVCHTTRVEI